ncbi:beta strand repeat-containing protein [Flavobacterium sp. 3HN19-14]|uniref:beta strand repeat-containing protein n=1 Tax=Flavobacterium sp. 3HN19-14 TaxID=3448133 RepID=UPI003EE1915A
MDSKGCTGSFSFTISQPAAALSVVANASTNVSCFGGNTGSASVTVTGGTAPYTYDWTGTPTGDATASITGITAGTWVCSVVDSKGCTGSFSFTITQPAAALSVVANASTNVNCFGGNTGGASVTVTGGPAPYTYDWTGTPIGDATASASGLTAGTWVCSVVDSKGCTGSFSFTITQPASALSASVNSSTNVSCFGGNTGAASVTVTGGTAPYTYDWTPGTPTGDGTASVTGLTQGTYVCNITDAKGCTTTRSFTITQPAAALSVIANASSNVSCFGGNTGSASVTVTGGTAPYTYDWTGTPIGDATATASGLTAGTWVCSVVDSKGCTGSFSFTITQPASALSASVNSSTNVSCFGGNTGAASVTVTGGTAPYTYDWTPGTPTGDGTASVTGLTQGTYICNITDAKGCTTSRSFTITQPAAALSVIANTSTNVNCFGGNTGSASVTVTGGTAPYTYDWTGLLTAMRLLPASGLTAGTWVCSVVDSKGCTGSFSFTITQPAAALSVVASTSSNVSCFGGNTGSASVTVTGGTAPYTYDWTGTPTGDATASASGLTAGTWVCSVVDSKGCTGSFSFTISQPAAALSVVANTSSNVSCFGGNTGSASVTVTGGTGTLYL